jgi:membrane fusion protein, multidrug efflux system
VVLGRDMGATMEVTQGITADDDVVANPPDYLIDGMPVSVRPVATE